MVVDKEQDAPAADADLAKPPSISRLIKPCSRVHVLNKKYRACAGVTTIHCFSVYTGARMPNAKTKYVQEDVPLETRERKEKLS
jgi:hypothetical protein